MNAFIFCFTAGFSRRAPLLVLLFVHSCFASSRCLSEADCPEGKVCIQGSCTTTCKDDADCEGHYICDKGSCRLPLACLGCYFPNANVQCDDHECNIKSCKPGFWDINGQKADGCEYACVPTSEEEICNGLDDNCNGLIDEGFDFLSSRQHCGGCDRPCIPGTNETALCINGSCVFLCQEGWFLDHRNPWESGCTSSVCIPQDPPVELCSGHDENCNGITDEGFEKNTPQSCGMLCHSCFELFPNYQVQCFDGLCHLGNCQPGFVDTDQNPFNGCECEITNNGIEICDGIDNDCDGLTDEGLVCCPEDMVLIQADETCISGLSHSFCIDIYEASIFESPSCSGTSYGTSPASSLSVICNYPEDFPKDIGLDGKTGRKLYACSIPDIYPSRCVSWYQARAACENSGKRLCTLEEWRLSCKGPLCSRYPYGNEFRLDVCNYLESWPDGDFQALPAGASPLCDNGLGVLDMSGNVWEYSANPDGRVLGGAYNCNPARAEILESCDEATFFPDIIDSQGKSTGYRNNIGFRCCL